MRTVYAKRGHREELWRSLGICIYLEKVRLMRDFREIIKESFVKMHSRVMVLFIYMCVICGDGFLFKEPN